MSDNRPTLVVLGGINGAGKSTLERYLSGRPEFREIVSLHADVETARLMASQPGLSATAAQFLGLRIVAEALQAKIVAKQSVITETVFASEAIIRIMRQAVDQGFKVIVYFVALADVETAIRRVALRVAKGGHNVPEADIRRRWPRAHENLARAVSVAMRCRFSQTRAEDTLFGLWHGRFWGRLSC